MSTQENKQQQLIYSFNLNNSIVITLQKDCTDSDCDFTSLRIGVQRYEIMM